MIRQLIQLTRPGVFLPRFIDEPWPREDVLVRPAWLSICAADQRYFTGNRPEDVLRSKLPMALLHEAVGEVLHDPAGHFTPGAKAALAPCAAPSAESRIAANYREGGRFYSSTCDGFAQEFLSLPRGQLVPLPPAPSEEEEKIYVFAEMVSVCVHVVSRWRALGGRPEGHAGIWGDGALGYILALTLKSLEPGLRLTVFGRHDEKLAFFSFVGQVLNVASRRKPVAVDYAFECVGGDGAGPALRDIIDHITPQGLVFLLGVSEVDPAVHTRLVLEKGLTLTGCSRSSVADFAAAVALIGNPHVQGSLRKIISEEREVRHSNDLEQAFREELALPFKSVLRWRV